MNLPTYITYLLMRFVNIECTLSEVQNKQYNSNKNVVLIAAEIEINDDKVAFLKNKNNEVKERRFSVDNKARTLLTLTSILLGLVSSTTSLASAKSVGISAILPIILLFLTIYLLTIYFGVERVQTVDYEHLFLDARLAKKILCNDMLKCQDYNERVTDFMIDLYRSALRYFSMGMLCIMILAVGNIDKNSNSMITTSIESITQNFANHILDNYQKIINDNLNKDTTSSNSEQARQLIQRVQLELTGLLPKNEIIDIITTIAVYKFSSLSREEVEAMLGLTLEETRVYREAKAEGEEKILKAAVPLLLKTGMTIEQIAQKLNVDVEAVRLAAQQNTDE